MKKNVNDNVPISLIPNVPAIIKIKIQQPKRFFELKQDLYSYIMKEILLDLCKQTQNCYFGYVISGHIYLLLLDKRNKKDGEMWYNGKIDKIISDSTSRVTSLFNKALYSIMTKQPFKPVKENYEDPKKFIKDLSSWKAQYDLVNKMFCDTVFTGTVFNISGGQLAKYFTNEQNKLHDHFDYRLSMYCVPKQILMDLSGKRVALRRRWEIKNIGFKNELELEFKLFNS